MHIRAEIPAVAQEFLTQLPMIVVASGDANGRMWASILTGQPGFVRAIDEQTIHIRANPQPTDPLTGNLQLDAAVGLLAIEFATRRRMRVNGRAVPQFDGSFIVQTRQVYSNCAKYIQARQLDLPSETPSSEVKVVESPALTETQQSRIAQADTFFIASSHPTGGADASHRGGSPGFVTVTSPNRLVWPDYAGNNMFNTLGNIAVNPAVGLLFIDFEQGSTLQLTGRAALIWDEVEIASYPGAQRMVSLEIDQVLETINALPFYWAFESYSPANP
jgi:predicted pyridoxine 5'-phosphate oxidase superfamily flavin-nucleotide-binding protein